jgi:hypothetical protein
LIETTIASPGRDISEAVVAYPNLILVQRLVDRVVVHMPSTGHLRSVPLAHKQPSKISMSFRKSRCEFVNRSALFADSLIECISNLISFDGAKKVYRFQIPRQALFSMVWSAAFIRPGPKLRTRLGASSTSHWSSPDRNPL